MKSRQSAIEKDRLLHNQKDVENKRSSDFAFIQLLIRFSSVIMSFVTGFAMCPLIRVQTPLRLLSREKSLFSCRFRDFC
jgi:hypothetical protein